MERHRNTKALVTLLIGPPEYRRQWEQVFYPSWKEYAERHGYDIVAIDDYIDPTERARERSPNWQKCLIPEAPELQGYEALVWLDSDILIRFLEAPCIVEATAPDKVGLVGTRAYPGSGGGVSGRCGWTLDHTIEQTYRDAGLEPVYEWANTGVFVIRPEHHAEILRHVYDTYEENPKSAKEELPLSHYLFGNGLADSLDPRFNWPWLYLVQEHYPFLLTDAYRNDPEVAGLCVNAAWHSLWFMHFTGDTPLTRHHAQLVIQWAAERQAFQAIHDNLSTARRG